MHIQTIGILMTGILFFLSGCNSAEIKKEQASQREDIHGLQEKIGQLQTDVQAVQDENDSLKLESGNLKDDLNASQDSNSQYQKDIKRLDDLVKKLDSAREQDRKVIVEEVSQEISRLSKKIQNASTSPKIDPARPRLEEGVEHVVTKGETLTSIAKTYGVSKKLLWKPTNSVNPILRWVRRFLFQNHLERKR